MPMLLPRKSLWQTILMAGFCCSRYAYTCPDSDACIMKKGTAYISDVGMTGPYDSVVGLRKEIAIRRFTLQTPHKYEPAENDRNCRGKYFN